MPPEDGYSRTRKSNAPGKRKKSMLETKPEVCSPALAALVQLVAEFAVADFQAEENEPGEDGNGDDDV